MSLVRTMTALACSAVLAVSFGPAGAQAQLTAADIPVELQETSPFGMGARAAGMGMAYSAVGEDATAIAFNPAALAQIRQVELSLGLAYDTVDHSLGRSGSFTTENTATRLDHLALAYPVQTYRGSLVWSVAFHREADLDQDVFMTGFLDDPGTLGSHGIVEVEDLLQTGTLNSWSGGIAMDLSRDISVGLALSYLSGTRTEDWVSAHGIPNTSSAERECEDGDGNPYVIPVDEYGLFYGCGLESEKSLFKQGVRRTVDASGWTGSLGILGHVGRGFRLAGVVNLPRWLQYQGTEKSTYEDYISSFSGATGFVDDITLPMSVRGGASWAHGGFLAAADMLWTDWKQIDFEGDIRAPDRTFAYRSTVALGLGAEYQIAGTPLRVRGGYRLDPLPYELITADGAVDVVASTLLRNYPRADITSDRTWLTLGGGVIFPAGLTLDIAYLHGSWERKTGSGFAPPNGFVTREKVTQNRVILTTAVHFQ